MKNRCNLQVYFSLCLLMSLLLACSPEATKEELQPELAYRTVNILEVDQYQFKDHNRNGELDPYEDWRLTNQERSQDLVSKMSLEQKAGFAKMVFCF